MLRVMECSGGRPSGRKVGTHAWGDDGEITVRGPRMKDVLLNQVSEHWGTDESVREGVVAAVAKLLIAASLPSRHNATVQNCLPCTCRFKGAQ